MKARQIELDILSENFDQTLGKYKPESLIAKVKAPTPRERLTVASSSNIASVSGIFFEV